MRLDPRKPEALPQKRRGAPGNGPSRAPEKRPPGTVATWPAVIGRAPRSASTGDYDFTAGYRADHLLDQPEPFDSVRESVHCGEFHNASCLRRRVLDGEVVEADSIADVEIEAGEEDRPSMAPFAGPVGTMTVSPSGEVIRTEVATVNRRRP